MPSHTTTSSSFKSESYAYENNDGRVVAHGSYDASATRDGAIVNSQHRAYDYDSARDVAPRMVADEMRTETSGDKGVIPRHIVASEATTATSGDKGVIPRRIVASEATTATSGDKGVIPRNIARDEMATATSGGGGGVARHVTVHKEEDVTVTKNGRSSTAHREWDYDSDKDRRRALAASSGRSSSPSPAAPGRSRSYRGSSYGNVSPPSSPAGTAGAGAGSGIGSRSSSYKKASSGASSSAAASYGTSNDSSSKAKATSRSSSYRSSSRSRTDANGRTTAYGSTDESVTNNGHTDSAHKDWEYDSARGGSAKTSNAKQKPYLSYSEVAAEPETTEGEDQRYTDGNTYGSGAEKPASANAKRSGRSKKKTKYKKSGAKKRTQAWQSPRPDSARVGHTKCLQPFEYVAPEEHYPSTYVGTGGHAAYRMRGLSGRKDGQAGAHSHAKTTKKRSKSPRSGRRIKLGFEVGQGVTSPSRDPPLEVMADRYIHDSRREYVRHSPYIDGSFDDSLLSHSARPPSMANTGSSARRPHSARTTRTASGYYPPDLVTTGSDGHVAQVAHIHGNQSTASSSKGSNNELLARGVSPEQLMLTSFVVQSDERFASYLAFSQRMRTPLASLDTQLHAANQNQRGANEHASSFNASVDEYEAVMRRVRGNMREQEEKSGVNKGKMRPQEETYATSGKAKTTTRRTVTRRTTRRSFRTIEEYRQNEPEVIKIQSAMRGRLARRRVQEKRRDLELQKRLEAGQIDSEAVQKHIDDEVRRRIAEYKEAEAQLTAEQAEAATHIQRASRGWKARREVKKKKTKAKEQKAALHIQCLARRKAARSRVERIRTALFLLNCMRQRRILVDMRKEREEEEEAARRIQALARGQEARRRVYYLRSEKEREEREDREREERLATAQALRDAMVMRQHVQELRKGAAADAEEEELAAVKLQSIARQRHAYRRVEAMRRADSEERAVLDEEEEERRRRVEQERLGRARDEAERAEDSARALREAAERDARALREAAEQEARAVREAAERDAEATLEEARRAKAAAEEEARAVRLAAEEEARKKRAEAEAEVAKTRREEEERRREEWKEERERWKQEQNELEERRRKLWEEEQRVVKLREEAEHVKRVVVEEEHHHTVNTTNTTNHVVDDEKREREREHDRERERLLEEQERTRREREETERERRRLEEERRRLDEDEARRKREKEDEERRKKAEDELAAQRLEQKLEKEKLEKERHLLELEKAAIRLQSAYRGHLVRHPDTSRDNLYTSECEKREQSLAKNASYETAEDRIAAAREQVDCVHPSMRDQLYRVKGDPTQLRCDKTLLQIAREAVARLDSQEIADCAEVKKPDRHLAGVAAAVCVLLREKPSWPRTRKLLKEEDLKDRIIALDPDASCSPKAKFVAGSVLHQHQVFQAIHECDHEVKAVLMQWLIACLGPYILSHFLADSHSNTHHHHDHHDHHKHKHGKTKVVTTTTVVTEEVDGETKKVHRTESHMENGAATDTKVQREGEAGGDSGEALVVADSGATGAAVRQAQLASMTSSRRIQYVHDTNVAMTTAKAHLTKNVADTEQYFHLQTCLTELDKARGKVNLLTHEEIVELTEPPRPPMLLVAVAASICILFHVKPAWPNVKAFMNEPEFRQRVIDLDVDEVTEHNMRVTVRLVDSNNVRSIASDLSQSHALRYLARWVVAFVDARHANIAVQELADSGPPAIAEEPEDQPAAQPTDEERAPFMPPRGRGTPAAEPVVVEAD